MPAPRYTGHRPGSRTSARALERVHGWGVEVELLNYIRNLITCVIYRKEKHGSSLTQRIIQSKEKADYSGLRSLWHLRGCLSVSPANYPQFYARIGHTGKGHRPA